MVVYLARHVVHFEYVGSYCAVVLHWNGRVASLTLCTVTFGNSTYRCGNYSREETIQGRKLYEEIRYVLRRFREGYLILIKKELRRFLSIYLAALGF